MRGIFSNGRVAVTLSATALFCAIGGGAYAAASSSKTITVCINHKGGALYQAKKCAKHDNKLSWNQKGVAGAAGTAGPAGASGATGATGAAGAAGPGAHLISENVPTGASTTGTIDGVWTYTLTCASGTPYSTGTLTFNGPGTVAGTKNFNGQPASSFPAIGVTTAVINVSGGPLEQTLWFQSGSTAAQVHLLVWSTGVCTIVGSATPLTS